MHKSFSGKISFAPQKVACSYTYPLIYSTAAQTYDLSYKLPTQTHKLHLLASRTSYSHTNTSYRKAAVLLNLSQCRIKNSSKCSNCYGPRAFGGPRSSVINLADYIVYDFFSLRSQYFAKFAVRSKRRFPSERCLCPEILV